MNFDPNNRIVKLCAEGMALEGEGKSAEALKLFEQAWSEAADDLEKFTAAHYVARQQSSIAGKLKWDEIALNIALKMPDDDIKATWPSLYLNVAKAHEDLNDLPEAQKNYALAQSFEGFLPNDGYGSMIRAGIKNGLDRVG